MARRAQIDVFEEEMNLDNTDVHQRFQDMEVSARARAEGGMRRRAARRRSTSTTPTKCLAR